MRDAEDGGFYCIDWDDSVPYEIFGREKDSDYQRLEAILTPCNYIHDYISQFGDSISPECKIDREKQFEYLDIIQLVVLYNYERLRAEKFDGSQIVKESIITTSQVNPRVPNWTALNFQVNQLQDETELIQYGQTSVKNYYHINKQPAESSSWADNLDENPEGRYKFTSVEINLDFDLVVTNR